MSRMRHFGIYVHVPYCRVRCGYCDFNTYTAPELGSGASQRDYAATARAEIRQAAAATPGRRVDTIFFGGGTPTILPAEDLVAMLAEIRAHWDIAHDAEITVEANPDTVTPHLVSTLAHAGVTRISLGMQSAVPHVLATLDRTHSPAAIPAAVRVIRDAGMDVSVDLIYGTPGESMEDWQESVHAALSLQPDHISAYALVIEEGTKMGAALRRGLIPEPDTDDQAAKYEYADAAFNAARYPWYEISNWAKPGHESRHNLGYWYDGEWWGIGPGAHSHLGNERWWNVKHPRAYAQNINAGESPMAGSETLSAEERELERIMLGIRLAEGLALNPTSKQRAVLAELVERGWVEAEPLKSDRVVLTLAGRLMADAVTRDLI